MLAGTAFLLSKVQAVGCSADAATLYWYFVPLSLHFGWTTAATLVNLNGSVAMEENNSDSTVIVVGHATSIAATAFGIGVMLAQAAPAYGFTMAGALLACVQGMLCVANHGNTLKKGAGVQKSLCLAGSAACVATSLYTIFV